jgi:hypothetical protein
MTKPNKRAGHLFPFKFYGPPQLLPRSPKNEKEKHVALPVITINLCYYPLHLS